MGFCFGTVSVSFGADFQFTILGVKMTFEMFKQQIKEHRLSKSWYFFHDKVEDKLITIKGYKTWLQVYKVNGTDYSNCMDVSVKQFEADLQEPFNYMINLK